MERRTSNRRKATWNRRKRTTTNWKRKRRITRAPTTHSTISTTHLWTSGRGKNRRRANRANKFQRRKCTPARSVTPRSTVRASTPGTCSSTATRGPTNVPFARKGSKQRLIYPGTWRFTTSLSICMLAVCATSKRAPNPTLRSTTSESTRRITITSANSAGRCSRCSRITRPT